MMYVELKKNFLLADSSELMVVRLISASWAKKTFDSYFLDIMYVELMKNFLLADSRHLNVLRLISASWEKKRLIPTFLTWYTSSWRKIFFSPIRANFSLLHSFRPPEPKNVDSFFLDKVYVECMKNFLLADSSELMAVRLISAFWAQKRWFFLSGQGVRRVHEKFSSRRFERADGC